MGLKVWDMPTICHSRWKEGRLSVLWSDEFDGSGPVDPEKWAFENGFLRNEELQWYQSENAVREDGILVIEGRQERRPNPNFEAGSNDWKTNREFIEYTSSSINTKDLSIGSMGAWSFEPRSPTSKAHGRLSGPLGRTANGLQVAR